VERGYANNNGNDLSVGFTKRLETRGAVSNGGGKSCVVGGGNWGQKRG